MTKHTFDLEKRTLEFASGSVGANYREANDSLSKKDFSHRIKITRKEAKESCYWLELLIEANPGYDMEINGLLAEGIELKKIFSAISDKCS
jgi:four helix bundle protein